MARHRGRVWIGAEFRGIRAGTTGQVRRFCVPRSGATLADIATCTSRRLARINLSVFGGLPSGDVADAGPRTGSAFTQQVLVGAV
jgi:hypothetical protein